MNPLSLLFYISPKSVYRDPLISEREIFCSPDDEDREEGGEIRTLKTPTGEFDIAQVLDRLPDGQQPELLVVKADASGHMLPRGIGKLKCPKVLVLGDTHHLPRPLSFLVEYAKAEPFDVILSDHDRHHLHWFKRAGLKRVHWIPALNYCWRPRPIAPPIRMGAVFVGQTGDYHPYRKQLMRFLNEANAPLSIGMAQPEKAADHYAEHAISLNCSLNGDLNLRVFEIIGSGGLLLTDRLSPDSGLERVFTDGEDLVLYRSHTDLKRKIDQLLAEPERMMRIRQAGFEKLSDRHTPEIKRRQLMELVFEGKEEPEFALDDSRTISLGWLPKESLRRESRIYEYIQELHRVSEKVILCGEKSAEGKLAYLGDLQRLEFQSTEEGRLDELPNTSLGLKAERIAVAESAEQLEDILDTFVGDRILLLADTDSATELRLEENGLAQEDNCPQLWVRTDFCVAISQWVALGRKVAAARRMEFLDSSSLDLTRLIAMAQSASELGSAEQLKRFLNEALKENRLLTDAYRALGDVAQSEGDAATRYACLREALLLSEEDDAVLDDELGTMEKSLRDAGIVPFGEGVPSRRFIRPRRLFPRIAFLASEDDEAAANCFIEAIGLLLKGGVVCEAFLGIAPADAELGSRLQAKMDTAELGDSGTVWYCGSPRETRRFWARANVAMLSADDERLSGAVAAGLTPVVAESARQSAGLIADTNCFVCDLEQAASVASIIAGLVVDGEFWKSITDAAREGAGV